MHSPVVHTSPEDSVDIAVHIMEDHGFSQVPVIKNGVPVGSISEDMIIKSMGDKKTSAISS